MSGYSFIDASNPQGERLVPQGSTVSDVHSFAYDVNLLRSQLQPGRDVASHCANVFIVSTQTDLLFGGKAIMAHVLNLCCNVVQLFATVWMMSLIIPEGAGFVYYWWILLDGFRVFVHSLLRLAIMVLRDQLGFFIYVIRSAQLMLCIFGVLMVAVGFPLSTVFIFNQPSHATGDDEQNASADKFFEALKTNITIISSCFILTHCTSALLVLRAFKQFRARGGADSFTHQRMTNPTSGYHSITAAEQRHINRAIAASLSQTDGVAGVDDDVADTGAGDHHGNNSIDTSNAGTYSGDLVDSSSDAALNVDVEAQRKLMREIQRKNERRQQAKDATLLRQMQDLEYEQALRADMGLDVNENIGGGGDMKDSYNEYTHAQNNDNVGVDIIDNDEDDALLDDALDYDDDDIDIDIDELGSEDLSSGDEYSRNSTHGQGHRKKRMPLSQRNRAGTHRDTVLAYVQNLRTFTQQQSGANTGVTDTQQTHPLSSPLLRVRIRLPGEIAPYSAASSSIQSSPSRGMLQLNISGSTSVSWLLATCEAAVLDALVSQYDAGNNSGNNHNHNHNINQNAMIPSVDLPLAPADSGSAAFTSEWFSRSFRLCVTYPRMILDDPDITLAELGIKHSTTLVLEEK